MLPVPYSIDEELYKLIKIVANGKKKGGDFTFLQNINETNLFLLQGIAKAKVEFFCPLHPVLYMCMCIVHVHIQGIIKLEVIRGKENVICPF